VYRLGHRAPSREARYAAAVEACGDGAQLRGRAAAHLHALIRGPAPPPEVVAPTERRIDGIITCRSRRVDPRDATVVLGIPVTTVARTLVDLAAVLGIDALARSCHEAGVKYGTTPEDVEAVLARRPNAAGAGMLRRPARGLPLATHRLTVELDGYRYHRSRQAWEQDRRREREARSRGDEFRRFTYADVFEDRRYLLAQLTSLLDM
jgi:hypothetical protein